MRVIKCSSIANAYEKGVRYVLDNGVMKHIHGTDVLQADPCTLDIKLQGDDFSEKSPLKRLATATYQCDFLFPDKGEQPYTYGERLRAYPTESGWVIDQLMYMADTLKEEVSSRQAVAVIWNPQTDRAMTEPPCFQYTQAFMNSKNEMEMVFLFRSNDWYQALNQNLIGLKVVVDKMVEDTGIPCNNISLIAVCPHIYWHNIEECKVKWSPTWKPS